MFMPGAGNGMTSRRNHRTTAREAERPAQGNVEDREGIGCTYVKNFANNLVKPTTTDTNGQKISTKIALSERLISADSDEYKLRFSVDPAKNPTAICLIYNRSGEELTNRD
jgi:hypothetical protein